MIIAKIITLNIGLKRNNVNAENSPGHTLDVLNSWGLKPTMYRIDTAEHEYGIERTVIAMLPFIGDTAILDQAIHAVSVELDQDCIAYAYEHNGKLVGELVGPYAADWGKFEAEYFLTFDTSIAA